MTAEGRTPTIIALIDRHLGGIFAALFAGFAAYLIGTTTTSHRLDQLEKDTAECKAEIKDIVPRLIAVEVKQQIEASPDKKDTRK